ncbi:hypothetical protein [Nonomuraea sp. KM90]|uniref:hypothetical protein n=1 Tax=Nonomuraea sp. KM90 TaxID=3457428 RepID=UPI003FCD5B35
MANQARLYLADRALAMGSFLGGLAGRAGVRRLVLTHLIPAPADEAGEKEFADDVRRGGYAGPLTVGRDLMTVTVG